MVARITRTSDKFPGLTLYLFQPTGRESLYIEFNHGGSREGFELINGEAYWADCSDRFRMPSDMVKHCRETARAYAAKLTTRKAA